MSGDHNMYASGSGDGQRSGWRKRTIMEMAREAGFKEGIAEFIGFSVFARFAEQVRADEREACAKLADSEADGWHPDSNPYSASTAIADTIRARGETK